MFEEDTAIEIKFGIAIQITLEHILAQRSKQSTPGMYKYLILTNTYV